MNYFLIEIPLSQSRSHVDLPQSPSIVITSMMINYYYHNNNYDNDKDNNDYSIDNWNQITSITMIACWPSQPTRGSTLTAILDLRSCFKFLLIITICTSLPKCPFIPNDQNGDEHKLLENLESSLERVWLPGSTLENVQELQERKRSKILLVKY